MTAPSTSAAPAGPAAIPPEEFLRHFPGHWIQYVDDGPLKDRRKAMGTPDFDHAEALRKQKDGCGVFFSPNAFDGMRRIGNLRHMQAAYVDLDCRREGDGTPEGEFEQRLSSGLAALRGFPLPPQVVIRTKNGLQAVWRVEPLSPADGLDFFCQAQELLVKRFGADPSAKDVTRVLRLPGFLHLKNPASPFLCHLLHDDLGLEPYPLSTLLEALRSSASAEPRSAEEPSRARGQGDKRWRSALGGVSAGERNTAAASVCGKLLAELSPELWETAGWGGLKECNALNRPPLPERELRTVFDSIAKRERPRRETGRGDADDSALRTQADKLVTMAGEEQAVFFRDQFGQAHASVRIGGHRETWRIRSKQVRMWLSSLLWEREGKAPTTNALAAALTVLEGRAFFGGRRIALHNRVAWHDGALWYDLTNDSWEAVRVTAGGWEVVSNPPILFQRHAHAEPQLPPKKPGDARAILPFMNLADDHQRVLLLVYLVSCFLPDIPHPVALLYGPHGAAKTTLARILRRIIDPSVVTVLAPPTSMHGLVQQLSHHWFAFFDNVSELPNWASDGLCRAVTGEGTSKRELYSDDEDVLYAFRRCVGLNGINLAARRHDLLDRSLLFKLNRVPKEERKAERALWAGFEEARPVILGGVFDAMSAALRLRPGVKLHTVPRMADFTEWGCAIAEALGLRAQDFLNAYLHNLDAQHEEAIQESAAATALTVFMQERRSWEGSPSELLCALTGAAEKERIGTRTKAWPAQPNTLMRRLNEAKGVLAEVGIVFESQKLGHGRRQILIRRIAETSGQASAPRAPASKRQPPRGAVIGGGNRKEEGGDGRREGGDTGRHLSPPQKWLAGAIKPTGGDGDGLSAATSSSAGEACARHSDCPPRPC